MPLVFEKQEFLDRLNATCRDLEKRDLDLALVFSPANRI